MLPDIRNPPLADQVYQVNSAGANADGSGPTAGQCTLLQLDQTKSSRCLHGPCNPQIPIQSIVHVMFWNKFPLQIRLGPVLAGMCSYVWCMGLEVDLFSCAAPKVESIQVHELDLFQKLLQHPHPSAGSTPFPIPLMKVEIRNPFL